MSGASVPVPAGAVMDQSGGAGSTSTPSGSGPAGKTVAVPQGAVTDPNAVPGVEPREETGYITNDVGNRVFVPREGESDADVMQRAVAYHKSLSPEQQKEAIDKETATMPGKVPQVLGAAALAGVAGPSALVAPVEMHAAMAAGIKAFIPALTTGVVAVGEWAEAHPTAAKAILETLKMAVSGTIAGKVAASAAKVIKAGD